MRKTKTAKGISTRRRTADAAKNPTPQERAGALEQRIAELTTEVDELTKQITQYHIAGEGDLEALTQDRDSAEKELKDVERALPLLRERIQRDIEALAQVQAADRMVAISRAHGGLSQTLDEDEARCRKAGVRYEAAVNQLNERFRNITLLRAESSALQDRFAIAAPEFRPVVVPNQRELVVPQIRFTDHAHRSPSTEANEYGARRRDYLEVQGTEAAAIIATVGLKGFPPISSAVQAAREREQRQEIEFSQRMAGEVDPTRAPPLPEHVR